MKRKQRNYINHHAYFTTNIPPALFNFKVEVAMHHGKSLKEMYDHSIHVFYTISIVKVVPSIVIFGNPI